MEQFFINAFWATNITLWVALMILYLILTHKRSLQRKGYNERYIVYLRKSQLIRLSSVAVGLPLILMFSAWIIREITGELTEEVQMAYIVIVMFILVIPLKFLDESINQKRIKKLALDTREKVVIDMNYRTLHLIYNPWLELILGILCLTYSVLILKIEQWIVYIYLIIPWLMYFTIRKLRYQVRPYLKDNYKYLFAFNIFSFLFFFGYFFVSLMIRMQAEGGVSATNQILPRLWLSLGFIISATLFARIGVYLASYKRFNAEISGKIYEIRNPRARKLVFFVASMLLLVSLTGIGLLTDILKRERIQVGRVLEKYVIDPDNGQPDTLTVISGMSPSGFQVVTDILQDHADGNLKLTCRIEECQSKDIRSYEICCSQTFDRIPMGTLVKFGYSPEFTITRLIED